MVAIGVMEFTRRKFGSASPKQSVGGALEKESSSENQLSSLFCNCSRTGLLQRCSGPIHAYESVCGTSSCGAIAPARSRSAGATGCSATGTVRANVARSDRAAVCSIVCSIVCSTFRTTGSSDRVSASASVPATRASCPTVCCSAIRCPTVCRPTVCCSALSTAAVSRSAVSCSATSWAAIRGPARSRPARLRPALDTGSAKRVREPASSLELEQLQRRSRSTSIGRLRARGDSVWTSSLSIGGCER